MRFLESVAAVPGMAVAPKRHEQSAWLRGRMARLERELVGATRCAHPMTDPVVLLDRPREVWCGTCVRRAALRQRADHDRDHTCDRCRRVVDLVHPFATQVAGVTVLGGLCADCLEREVGE